MSIVSYMFHPWVKLMKARGVQPRGFADDLTITATGPRHEQSFRDAYEATFYYLGDLGARPAPKKCFTFNTSADTRFRLGMHHWRAVDTTINVIMNTRDLGGHLSTQARLNGSTLTKRIRRATTIASKLSCMPWDFEAKHKFVESLVFPLGLYGSEACPAA